MKREGRAEGEEEREEGGTANCRCRAPFVVTPAAARVQSPMKTQRKGRRQGFGHLLHLTVGTSVRVAVMKEEVSERQSLVRTHPHR